MSEKKNEMIVREGSDKEPMYWTGSEPTMLDKAKNKVGEVGVQYMIKQSSRLEKTALCVKIP